MKYKIILLLLSCLWAVTDIPAQDKELDIKTIWYSPTFSGKYVSGLNSMADGRHYTSLVTDRSGTSIVKYSYKTGEEVQRLVNSAILPEGHSIDDYSFNPNETRILIASKQESIYRHSTKADYFIYDLSSKKLAPVADHDKGPIRLATFSPTSDRVAYVRENDIYIQDVKTMRETRVTKDGKVNSVINGATDWVYEEEFGFDRGLYWSSGGEYIAFYRFDESAVKQFQMAIYGGQLYPEQYTFKYPKAGEANSEVSIHVHDIKSGTSRRVEFSDREEYYIPRIKWMEEEGQLSLMKMNRHQNVLQYLKADATDAQSPTIEPVPFYTEKSDTYIEVNDNLIFIDKGKKFILTSDRDGYNHIYVMDMNGEVVKQVTSGEWDVIDFSGFDAKDQRVYYTSSEEGVTEQNVYSISISAKGKKRLSPNDGQNTADFSDGFNYYILYHSDANSPYRISLHNADGKEIRVLEENNALRETMSSFDFQPKEFFTFTTERGDELNGWMIKPPGFDESKEYPLLLAIYGGPGHNTVTNSFGGRNYYWHQLLAKKGYIVASVDPRGTYYRGRDFKNSTYMQLGKLETEDMVSAANYLKAMDYVDGERIGMQGWSFGGYLTSSCLMRSPESFKMGIAVAPVTNWRYYDTIYTERFMRTPQENPEGYDENSPIHHAENLEDPYLLIHGAADDNVHYQNTMEMVEALVKANKQFDLFIYPDKNHGIYGGTTRMHLYQMMTDFVEENL